MAVVGLGDRELQHIGGLDVRGLFEHGHEFGKIVEPGKAGLGAVAGALGIEFVKILFVDFLN